MYFIIRRVRATGIILLLIFLGGSYLIAVLLAQLLVAYMGTRTSSIIIVHQRSTHNHCSSPILYYDVLVWELKDEITYRDTHCFYLLSLAQEEEQSFRNWPGFTEFYVGLNQRPNLRTGALNDLIISD